MKLISILKQVIVEANVIPWWAVTPTGLERFNRKLKKDQGYNTLRYSTDKDRDEKFYSYIAKEFITHIYINKGDKVPELKSDIISKSPITIKTTGEGVDSVIILEKGVIKDFDVTVDGEKIEKTEKRDWTRSAEKPETEKPVAKKEIENEKEIEKRNRRIIIAFQKGEGSIPRVWNIKVFNKYKNQKASTEIGLVQNMMKDIADFVELQGLDREPISGKGTKADPMMKGDLKLITKVDSQFTASGTTYTISPENTEVYFQDEKLFPVK